MGNVAIHGFGRIGRTLLRIALKRNLFTPVSVSDIRDIPTLAALFEVDTNYGRWEEEVKPGDKGFTIGGRKPTAEDLEKVPAGSEIELEISEAQAVCQKGIAVRNDPFA